MMRRERYFETPLGAVPPYCASRSKNCRKELGQKGENLNADIGDLVKAGLRIQVQRSLDIVRVVGNNQVHPGTLDVRDDPSWRQCCLC